MDAFSRYAPFIQDYIFRQGWEQLRAVQVAAADAIFNTEDNVLLSASTASGKTEAAFFPVLTLLEENPPASVGAIYIAPLKALINDQFSRLTELCEPADIKVWRWHGDVGQSQKAKLLKHPSGILQITPESLEALMLHKHAMIPALFRDLRFVIIDEVHSLLRGDRGGQTLCLIERLSDLSGAKPRRIGLSATIGNIEQAAEYLGTGSGRRTVIPQLAPQKSTWRLSMEHFYAMDTQAAEGREIEAAEPLERETDPAPSAADPAYGYIFAHTQGKKCLVFVNSREECEAVTTSLRQYCETKHEPERFLIHHGNLSAAIRETAEAVMKDEEQCLTTVTTATLELGIDIGKLERAFQLDAPFTVSSFLQRMGRTGRRGLPPEMWFVMREEEPEARAMLPSTVPWKLLQGIALVQLYAEEHWVEPPKLDRLPFSLLYHQTMSTLAANGEMTPAQLAGRVLKLQPFHRITQDDYRILLRHLIEKDHIQRTERGGLIAGLAGERVLNHYKFYAVFQDSEEFTVRSESQEIGTIVQPPPAGEKIAIAGRVWVVDEVDFDRHTVYCTMVRGKVPAYFGDCPGDIQTKILERMRRVLQEEQQYPYLMKNAAARLAQARHTAENSGLLHEPLICLGGDMWALFPWLGSYAFLALERFLKIRCAKELFLSGLSPARPYFITFKMKADKAAFFRVLREQAEAEWDPMELVYPDEIPLFEKYDEYVPAELVRKGFAYGILAVDEMKARVLEWAGTMLPAVQ
ncbi:MAG: DEAD/DEAH box helicase [Oscillospiraceae bacterium]|nr:DEAD/DEAH box helicase [Oscillospiraceae bacterium]